MAKKQSKQPKTLLTIQQENFCYYYMLGCKDGENKFRIANSIRSYAKAYSKNLTDPKQYSSCGVLAARLLKNVKIQARMHEILEEQGFHYDAIDSRLREIIFNGDDNNSNTAIREFNMIAGRRIEHVEHKIITPVTKIVISPITHAKTEN